MNKILLLFLCYLFLTSCSLDKSSGLWTNNDKIEIEKDLIVEELFKKDKELYKELNLNVRID